MTYLGPTPDRPPGPPAGPPESIQRIKNMRVLNTPVMVTPVIGPFPKNVKNPFRHFNLLNIIILQMKSLSP